MKLKDKVAIVTGAGFEEGFGRAMAMEFAKEGANVVVADIAGTYPILPHYKLGTADDLEKRVEELKALGSDPLAVILDVRSKASVHAMVQAVVKKYGKINILVNNAGFVQLDKYPDIHEDIWDLHMSIMAKGSFLCSQAVIPEMLKSGERGKIINISSIAGLAGWGFAACYCAAKYAQVGLTKSLAHEFAAQNINVNAICPGLQTTAYVGHQFVVGGAKCTGLSEDEVAAFFVSTMPQGKMGQPQDVAKTALFLASSDSDHITGAAVEVSGGQRW